MMVRAGVMAAGALLMTVGAAAAQACLGLPSRDGQVAVSVSYASLDEGAEIGGEFHADVSGPAAFGFGYRAADGSSRESYFGHAAYDLFLLEPAVCPVAGVEFTGNPSPEIDERLAVPLGFGIGKTVGIAPLSATVYAAPRYAWVREVRTQLGTEQTETSHAFLGEAGVTLGFSPFHLGGAVVLSSLPGDDPSFRLRAGIRF